MTVQEFRDRLKGGKYLQFLEKCKGKDLTGKRIEKHHIYPKSFKVEGEGTSELIKLSVGDHVLVHIYLFEDLERFGKQDKYYYKALYAVNISISMQYSSLPEEERDGIKLRIPDIEQTWEKAKKANSDRLHSPEVWSKAMSKARNTCLERYGDIMGRCHDPEIIQKSLSTREQRYGTKVGRLNDPDVRKKSIVNSQKTLISRYGSCTSHMNVPEIKKKARERAKEVLAAKYGNCAGALHAPEIKEKAKRLSAAAKTLKFGNPAGNMHNPVSELKRQIIRNRKKTIVRTDRFREWFKDRKHNYYKCRSNLAVNDYLAETNQKLSDFPEYSI